MKPENKVSLYDRCWIAFFDWTDRRRYGSAPSPTIAPEPPPPVIATRLGTSSRDVESAIKARATTLSLWRLAWSYADECDLKKAVGADGVEAVVIVEMPTNGNEGFFHFRPAEDFKPSLATGIDALMAYRESAFESNFYALRMGFTEGPVFRGRLPDGTMITTRPSRPTSNLVKTPREWLP